jgi:F-type H+-transporting ATPase subunit b
MLNLDSSIFIIVVLVWLLLMVLDKLYFKPVGTVIDERDAKIKRESDLIDSMTVEIEEKTLHIETTLKDTRKEAARIKEELIKKGESVREKIVTDAREKSKELFNSKMIELEGEIAAAEKQLVEQVALFSAKLKEIFIN